MPFTPAHPAFVLPLRRLGLPLGALAIGSMVPDTPMYFGALVPGFPTWAAYAHTHSPFGLVTTDLIIGLVLWALWQFLLRPALDDGLPRAVRRKAGALASAPLSARQMSTVPLAVLIGTATHIGLDELSHGGRWAARNFAWFRETHFGLVGTSWVQYGAGVFGLLTIAVVLSLGWWRALPRADDPIAPALARWVWLGPLVVGMLAVAVAGINFRGGAAALSVAFRLATAGGATMLLTALLVAVAWRVVTAGTAGPRPPAGVDRSSAASVP